MWGKKVALRLLMKWMNDTMGPGGLVPSLFVFGMFLFLPVIGNPLLAPHDRVGALFMKIAVMYRVSEEPEIALVIQSKLTNATKFNFEPGDAVQLYQ